MGMFENVGMEFRSRNFSIYGQWTGIIAIILCIAVGISNFFNIFKPLLIVFAAICLASGLVLIFVEIPLLLKICPTSPKFDETVRKFHSNYGRAGLYVVLSIVQWLSLLTGRATSLIAAAVVLLIAGTFYGIAALKKQEFMGSKTLSGSNAVSYIV